MEIIFGLHNPNDDHFSLNLYCKVFMYLSIISNLSVFSLFLYCCIFPFGVMSFAMEWKRRRKDSRRIHLIGDEGGGFWLLDQFPKVLTSWVLCLCVEDPELSFFSLEKISLRSSLISLITSMKFVLLLKNSTWYSLHS